MEKTLILLKPDALQRGIVGEIVTRFEKVGLKIIGVKMLRPSDQHYYEHYETIGKMISRRGKEAFEVTKEYMQVGPVLAVVLEGIEAVSIVRKMIGTTDPKSALPGTIRGDYSHLSMDYANSKGVSIPNLIHASGDSDEAKLEIKHWFKDSELFTYSNVHDKFTLAKS